MRRILFSSVVVAVVLAGCGSGGGGTTRQVLVDYKNDRFTSVFRAYFPASVTVRQGDTVHFRQAWNGEPHSVTMGTLVDEALRKAAPVMQQLNAPGGDSLFGSIFAHVPFMTGFGPTANQVVQAGAQPCYLDTGDAPTDPNTPCPRRRQPAFNGRQSIYSSGFIPYAGNNGNSFTMKIADDTAPGTYQYFCNFHGPGMQGAITVKAKGASIPSQHDVDRDALTQANAEAKPAQSVLDAATSGPFSFVKAVQAANFPVPPGVDISKLEGDYFAGYGAQSPDGHFTSINEFVPKTIRATVGKPVTWLLVGNHTVSFNVPRYFPQLDVGADGVARFDHRADQPVGGPGFPPDVPNPPNPYIADGGAWNGQGFRSSGLPPQPLVDADNQITGFTLTFGRAGTYQYACLIHPGMVGTVVAS